MSKQREVKIDHELQIELMKQLEKLESSTDLEGTAIISKTGLRIASSTHAGTEADLHSAGPAALIALGDKLSQGLDYGDLSEIVIAGENGYSVITVGDEKTKFMLLTHCRKGYKLGYYFHRLRKSYKKLQDLLQDVEIGEASY
jgi:predicted regulator of Ras-like GTPase activity (Roadblock/LC7/MglB family)